MGRETETICIFTHPWCWIKCRAYPLVHWGLYTTTFHSDERVVQLSLDSVHSLFSEFCLYHFLCSSDKLQHNSIGCITNISAGMKEDNMPSIKKATSDVLETFTSISIKVRTGYLKWNNTTCVHYLKVKHARFISLCISHTTTLSVLSTPGIGADNREKDIRGIMQLEKLYSV